MRFVVRIHQQGWTYPELETVWRESERLGYDGASLYDVLGDSGPECWTALTALTAVTQKLVVVPLVLANPYRHPAVVGKMAATLDALSRGRVILGLGAGGSATDALIGGHGPHLLRAAARHADLCNVGFDLPVDSWRSLGPVLAGYLGEAGRSRESLGFTHNATVLLGADEADVARQVSAWAGRRGLTEEAARGRLGHSLTGTPGQVSERLRALAAAGVGWVFLLFDDLPRLAGLRSFAEAVMPALHSGRDEGTEPP